MLADGWTPDSSEAKEIGLVASIVVENALLLDAADDAVRRFVCDDHRRFFSILVSDSEICQEYGVANAQESISVADSCLS